MGPYESCRQLQANGECRLYKSPQGDCLMRMEVDADGHNYSAHEKFCPCNFNYILSKFQKTLKMPHTNLSKLGKVCNKNYTVHSKFGQEITYLSGFLKIGKSM